MFETFILSKLSSPFHSELTESFNQLTEDTISYNRTGASTRRRGFGAFRYVDGEFQHDPELSVYFNARRDFHVDHADKKPNPLIPEVIQSKAYNALLNHVAPCLPIELSQYAIGINQIRVVADDDKMGSTAPGLHQDGYDYSCHICIARRNAAGGTSIVSTSQNADDVVLEQVLQPREFVFFNDRSLYHTATPVTCRIGGSIATRDMIIVDFVRRSRV
jgi:hypothetical protein